MLVDPFRELLLLCGLRFKAGLLLNGTLALVSGRHLCVARHRRPRLLAALYMLSSSMLAKFWSAEDLVKSLLSSCPFLS